jgi:hypothetical protein
VSYRLLDLYCGGGGAGSGYADVGFEVVGVDINPQPDYPFEFHQWDAINTLTRLNYINSFDVIHASPPCQKYSYATTQWKNLGREYPDLIGETRKLLLKTGKPFIIENVVNAPLRKDLLLCGQMFGLNVRRHRIFEIEGFFIFQPEHQKHIGKVGDGNIISVFGHGGGKRYNHCSSDLEVWKKAMGIDWMTKRKTLAESIPPSYTRYIGEFAIKQLYKENKNVLSENV